MNPFAQNGILILRGESCSQLSPMQPTISKRNVRTMFFSGRKQIFSPFLLTTSVWMVEPLLDGPRNEHAHQSLKDLLRIEWK